MVVSRFLVKKAGDNTDGHDVVDVQIWSFGTSGQEVAVWLEHPLKQRSATANATATGAVVVCSAPDRSP
jgi:hypothetical protein